MARGEDAGNNPTDPEGTLESDKLVSAPLADNSPLQRVDAEDIGVSKQVFKRARFLTDFCLMAYPGGTDFVGLEAHLKNRQAYAANTRDSFRLDSDRLLRNLADMNCNQPDTGRRFRAELFRASKQQGAIFYNEHEIVISFEGSDGAEPRHWIRNLFKSLNSYQKPAYFSYIANPKDRQAACEIAAARTTEIGSDAHKALTNSLRDAKVHGGWWDTLNLPLLFSTNGHKDTTLWEGMQDRLEHITKMIETQTGERPKITFTGHSSGGALSMIAAARWMENHPPVDEIYTFGQPRVGNIPFREVFYTLMGKTLPPIYRFEMVGDPVPSLPPLWSLKGDHLVHCGNWVCTAPNGNLAAIRHGEKVVTAAEASQSVTEPMVSFGRVKRNSTVSKRMANTLFAAATAISGGYDQDQAEAGITQGEQAFDALFDSRGGKHSNFARASDEQRFSLLKRYGGPQVSKDHVFASIMHTILDLHAHWHGESAYRHVLPTMRTALSKQLAMEELRERHGNNMPGSITLGQELAKLIADYTATKPAAHTQAILDKVEHDSQIYMSALSLGARLSETLTKASTALTTARSSSTFLKPDEPGSLVQLAENIKIYPELAELHARTRELIRLFDYQLAANTPILGSSAARTNPQAMAASF